MSSVSVVMPAYNEADLLEQAVREVVDGLRRRRLDFEVLVVENGSTDGTPALAARLAAELPEVRSRSLGVADYGAALREGLLGAGNDLVANFDVDYVDLGFLDTALERLLAPDGAHLVVGTKRGAGSRDTRSWARRFVTGVYAAVLRLGFGLHVSDTHGMKAMRREPLSELARRCRFGTDLFDTELILRAERAGLTVEEVGVAVEERRPSRTSIARRVPRTLVGLVRLRLLLARGG